MLQLNFLYIETEIHVPNISKKFIPATRNAVHKNNETILI